MPVLPLPMEEEEAGEEVVVVEEEERVEWPLPG